MASIDFSWFCFQIQNGHEHCPIPHGWVSGLKGIFFLPLCDYSSFLDSGPCYLELDSGPYILELELEIPFAPLAD